MQPILKTTLLLAILHHLPSTLATTSCTDSNAIPWPQSGSTSTGGDSGGGGSSSTTTDDGCSAADLARDDTGCVNEYCTTPGSTSDSLQACFCLALGGCDTTTTDPDDFIKKRGATGSYPRQKRADFECSSGETCFYDSDAGELFCLDLNTGDYVGEDGESGNAYTGDSGGDDGSTATATATATDDSEPTTTVASTSASDTATTTSTEKSAKGASSATATTTKSASTTAASTTIHSAGAARVTAGAVVGALAFAAVGFAL